MSDLHARVAAQLYAFLHAENDTGTANENATVILDMVAEALMSEAAVDAMLECSYGWVDYEAGTTYKDLPESEKAGIRPEGRHELTAALTAAGIVKGEGDAT